MQIFGAIVCKTRAHACCIPIYLNIICLLIYILLLLLLLKLFNIQKELSDFCENFRDSGNVWKNFVSLREWNKAFSFQP
jgi:hypothetical protein